MWKTEATAPEGICVFPTTEEAALVTELRNPELLLLILPTTERVRGAGGGKGCSSMTTNDGVDHHGRDRTGLTDRLWNP